MSSSMPGTSVSASPTRRSSEIFKINHVAAALLRQQSLEDLVWTLAEEIGAALDFDDCVVYLREGDSLLQVAAFGPKSPADRKIKNPISIEVGDGITGLVARSGISMLIRDTAEDPLYVPDIVEGRSELAVPLVHAGEVLGVIDSESPQVGAFSEADRGFMQQVADLAAPRLAAARAEAAHRADLERRILELESRLRAAGAS